ncbi:class I SAM-dependent methyltransferase [Pseudaeromonas sp. ZJS20]|uniref:class I SAM-dependent DNA methyltransferase n=1 Tax=Pseudaeromonas aegiceratis TaxID=3153928 RepID=UPI00390CCD6B
MTRYFDAQASRWDADPAKLTRARITAEGIRALRPAPGGRLLEFGCGTGLLGLQLAESFDAVALVDASAAMLAQARQKIDALALNHVQTRQAERLPAQPPQDAVACLMVLHHVRDLAGFFADAHALLAPGGQLFVADLYPEDGAFHRQHADFAGHNGLDPEALAQLARAADFAQVRHAPYFTIEKTVDGAPRQYPLFLLMAQKA